MITARLSCCEKKCNIDTVSAVQRECEAVLLLFQLDVTLFHRLLQRRQRPKYSLNTLIHRGTWDEEQIVTKVKKKNYLT